MKLKTTVNKDLDQLENKFNDRKLLW